MASLLGSMTSNVIIRSFFVLIYNYRSIESIFFVVDKFEIFEIRLDKMSPVLIKGKH